MAFLFPAVAGILESIPTLIGMGESVMAGLEAAEFLEAGNIAYETAMINADTFGAGVLGAAYVGNSLLNMSSRRTSNSSGSTSVGSGRGNRRRRSSTSTVRSGSTARNVRRRTERKKRPGRKRRVIKRRRDFKKEVKGIVKSVMECKESTGTYNKHYTGEIEPYVNAGQHRISYSMTRNQGNTAPYNVFDLTFGMTRKKILDAVSVLYNNKARGINWSSPTNNFAIKGLKVDLLYASLDIKFTNYTEWCYEVEIFECTSKANSESPVLDELSKALTQDEWVGANPTFSSATTTAYDIDSQLEFGMIKAAKAKYAITKVKSGKLYPGHTVQYFKKWGHQCIDFTKELVLVSGTQVLPSYAKGDTQVLIRYTPVMHMHTSLTTSIATNLANSTDPKYGFIVDVKEVFKFPEPAETDELYAGDKRAMLIDVPFLPSGSAPYVQRYMHTGPTFVNIDNPRN